MITLFQVDKSGSEIFEKDYSISVVKNKKIVYGINVPQNLKDKIMYLFNTGELRIKSTSRKKERARLKIRFHTAIIILLLKDAIKKDGKIKEIDIQICNDIDGHFHEIKNMIYNHLSKILPSLKRDDIVQTRFPKTTLVDISAKNLRENNKEEINNYILPKIEINELIKIIKK